MRLNLQGTIGCFTILLLTLLPGCTDKFAQSLLQDYLKRVENATGFVSEAGTTTVLMPYPSHRDRTVPESDIRLGFMDFFKLYDCDLFALINERNSIMGKLMPASRKLVYEIGFFQSAGRCLEKLEQAQDNVQFRAELASIIEAKQTSLHTAFWRATFDSEEMQKTFSLAGGVLPADTTTPSAESQRAIAYFIAIGERLTDPTLAVDIDEMEAHNYALQMHRYGGSLAQTLALSVDYLNRISGVLKRSAEDLKLCLRGESTSQARTLHALYTDYFHAEVQPYLATLHRQGREWLEGINRLLEVQRVDPPQAFRGYHARMLSLDNEQGLWRAFDQARQHHADIWKTLLEPCRL